MPAVPTIDQVIVALQQALQQAMEIETGLSADSSGFMSRQLTIYDDRPVGHWSAILDCHAGICEP